MCNSRRNRDKASYNGDKAAQKYGIVSFAVKPAYGLFDVVNVQMKGFSNRTVYQRLNFFHGKDAAQFIKEDSSCKATYGSGDNDPGQIHLGKGGHKAAEGKNNFRRDRGKDIFNHNEKGNAKIAVSVQNFYQQIIYEKVTVVFFYVYAKRMPDIRRI